MASLPPKTASLTRDAAEARAISVLQFIAGDPEQLQRFLGLSGIDPERLREAAGEPGFLAGVLDFLLGDESAVLAYAANAGVDPTEIAAARRVLDINPTPHSTDF